MKTISYNIMFRQGINVLGKSSIVTALLMFTAGLSLSAYQQGSYFLFDVREDAKEGGKAGRIAVAASAFKVKKADAKTQLAKKEAEKSEFESGISVFETADSNSGSNQFLIQEEETTNSKPKASFGESPKTPSGFFFTY